MKKIIVAAGGSGGHVFPALAVASRLKEQNIEVIFIAVGLDQNRFFPRNEFKNFTIEGSYFSKNRFFSFFWKNFYGTFQSIKILKQERPNSVIGFGSYHSFPVILATKLMGIQYSLFEPNLELGKVNNIFLPWAKWIFSYFSLGLKKEKLILPPTEYKKISIQEAKLNLSITDDKPIFLVVGGSQGAKWLNKAMQKITPNTLQQFFVVHIAGKNENLQDLKDYYKKIEVDVRVLDFTDRMQEYWSIADFAFCRSGASTIYELIYFKKPALLAPYGLDKKGHQVSNAKYLAEKLKAADIIYQQEESYEAINAKLDSFLKNKEQYRKNLENININPSQIDWKKIIRECFF